MAAPKEIVDLVERFESNPESYISGHLKELSLVIFIIIVQILWFSQSTSSFLLQLITFMAEASIGVFVTLTVIEKALKDDRKRQSEKIRRYTYRSIIWNICKLTIEAIWLSQVWPDKRPKRIDAIKTIGNDVMNPRKEVSDAIKEVACAIDDEVRATRYEMLKKKDEYINQGKKEEWQKKWDYCNQITTDHFKKIDRTLSEIRNVQIPRALQIADDRPNLIQALLDFEDSIRFYEHVVMMDPNFVSTDAMKKFLLATSKAYDALELEYRNENFPRTI